MSLSIHTLPIDIIYRIFDHLNDKDIFISTNNVNQRLNAILNTYQRFQVNLTKTLTFFTCKSWHPHFTNITLKGLSVPKFAILIFPSYTLLSIVNKYSSHSTSLRIKLAMMVYEQLLKHYKEIKWDKYLVSSSRLAMFFIHLRHSLHSTSYWIRSALKMHEQLIKHYKEIEWDK